MSENGGGPPNRDKAATSLPKRFYEAVTTEQREDGYVILLDGRPVRTPGKRLLALPTPALAEAVAAEWAAQIETIDPRTMPLTRLINTAIERVRGKEQEVKDDIVSFAGSDLLCYRAETPDPLAVRQKNAWDPVLEWAAEHLGARFEVARGIMPVRQSDDALAAIAGQLADFDALALSAMHQLTTLSGSAVLALAVLKGHLSVNEAWTAAHIDEDWQIEHWGEDAEAKARRVARRQDFDAAWTVLMTLNR